MNMLNFGVLTVLWPALLSPDPDTTVHPPVAVRLQYFFFILIYTNYSSLERPHIEKRGRSARSGLTIAKGFQQAFCDY